MPAYGLCAAIADRILASKARQAPSNPGRAYAALGHLLLGRPLAEGPTAQHFVLSLSNDGLPDDDRF